MSKRVSPVSDYTQTVRKYYIGAVSTNRVDWETKDFERMEDAVAFVRGSSQELRYRRVYRCVISERLYASKVYDERLDLKGI